MNYAEEHGMPALDILYPDGAPSCQKRNEAWSLRVPLIYVGTRADRLPRPDLTKHALDLVRDGESRYGLILFGPSGTGKTRTAYLAARLAMDLYGDKLAVVTGKQLRDRATKLGRTGDFSEWARDLVESHDVLVLEDIGHGSASDSYLSGVLELIEEATANRAFLVVTSQFAGRQLIGHWGRSAPDSQPTAEAIVRRLGEFCHPVNFGAARRNSTAPATLPAGSKV